MEVRDASWGLTHFLAQNPFRHLIEARNLAMVPPHLWTGFMVGILLGWAWKPVWVRNMFLFVQSKWSSMAVTAANLLQTRRIQLLLAHFSKIRILKKAMVWWFNHKHYEMFDMETVNSSSASVPEKIIAQRENPSPSLASTVIGDEDFEDLKRRLQGDDGGVPWFLMMERSAPGITYQAWRRDPHDGPTEYKSRTVFEDATPDLVKDFYWDDAFRPVWDDMLIHAETLEGCRESGSEIARWVRKFPFFCSDREYLIGRRIFEYGGTFFCITKAVPYEGVPRKEKPLRVDIYYSSWCIRAAESTKKDGQTPACEVMLFHSEDMHIPRHIAKFAVQQGMWACVKKMEPGLRKYQLHQSTSKTLSWNAQMAQIYTRVPCCSNDDSIVTEKVSNADTPTGSDLQLMNSSNYNSSKKDITEDGRANGLKWLIVGGAVVLACTLDRGALGKVLVFGMARRFAKLNRRL